MAIAAGTRLGPYEIQATLGRGGMGSACGCCRASAASRAAASDSLEPERRGWGPGAVKNVGSPRALRKERSLASCR